MTSEPNVGLPSHFASGGAQSLATQAARIRPYAQGAQARSAAPLQSTIMQEVYDSARNRANALLREIHAGLPPEQIQALLYKPDQSVPALLVLIEVLNFLEQPKKHDALQAMRDLPIEISVYVPTGHMVPGTDDDIGCPVTVRWRRTDYTFYPYVAKSVPVHVAIQLLNQIGSFKYSPDVAYRESNGVQVPVQRKLLDHEKPQIGFLPFRMPTVAEQQGRAEEHARWSQNQTSVRNTQGGGDLILNLNPRASKQGEAIGAATHPNQGTQQPMPAMQQQPMAPVSGQVAEQHAAAAPSTPPPPPPPGV